MKQAITVLKNGHVCDGTGDPVRPADVWLRALGTRIDILIPLDPTNRLRAKTTYNQENQG